jgi:glycosyltransferase involved in cell wall biosynthesis
MKYQIKSEKNEDISFICFGGEDWWYHNQAHIDMQLMRRFSRLGTTLYVNSIVMRKLNIGDRKGFTEKLIRKTKSILKGLKQSGVGFWVYSPYTLPVQHISWARPFNEAVLRYQIRRITRKLRMMTPVMWVACPPACDAAIAMKRGKLVYQRTDRYEDDPHVDRETVLNYDRKLKACADITVYVNQSLYEEEADQCKNAFFLDHGVDYEMFTSAENNPDVPAEIANIRKPVVGYFGVMADHKFDVEFISRVADLLPEFSFVFIGRVSQESRGMFAGDNIHILPKQPYERIPHFGKCFDVAVLPWRINKWTEAANPIKLKEYLALGKPIVSTPAFSELQSYLDIVYEAATPEDFARCIKKAHSENNVELVRKRRERVAQSSWDSKAELMLRTLFAGQEFELRMITDALKRDGADRC